MTSSNGNIFRVTGHLCGEFTGPGEFPAQWPVTRGIDVFFDLRLNERLGKQSWGWWFETLSCPLWRHRNVLGSLYRARQPCWCSMCKLRKVASLHLSAYLANHRSTSWYTYPVHISWYQWDRRLAFTNHHHVSIASVVCSILYKTHIT